MMWVVLVLLGFMAIPVTTELTRTGLTETETAKAPGQFALLSQGTTHFEWLGPERGPVAVCIHGLTTPSFVWRGLAIGLALLGFRVLVYDLYGRGFSERVRGLQDADFFDRQLTDLLTHEAVENQLTIIGYSMGGSIATHFAARHPDRVKQLILLAPAGLFQLADRKLTCVRDVPVIGDWLFLAFYPWTLRRSIASEADQPTTVDNIHELQQAETTRRGYFPAVLSSLRGLLRTTDEEQHQTVAAMQVPVLAIWGDQDDVIPLTCKDRLADWNPNARHVVIKHAGHGLTYTHTDAVLEAIKSSRG